MKKHEKQAQVICNIITRLKEQNCGCSHSFYNKDLIDCCNDKDMSVASRIYIYTWLIGPLELLLKGNEDAINTALSMSS